MPTYVYRCKGCEHGHEEFRKMAERHEPTEHPCPDCGGELFLSLQPLNISYSGVNVKDKRPEGWKDVLKRASKYAGRHSTIDV